MAVSAAIDATPAALAAGQVAGGSQTILNDVTPLSSVRQSPTTNFASALVCALHSASVLAEAKIWISMPVAQDVAVEVFLSQVLPSWAQPLLIGVLLASHFVGVPEQSPVA